MGQPNDPSTSKRNVQPTSQNGPESADPASPNGAEKETLCSQCKTVQVKPPITKCKCCNSIYNRVQYYKNLMDEKSMCIWDEMDKDKKAEFIKSAKHWWGNHLKSQLQQFIDKSEETRLEFIRANTREIARNILCPWTMSNIDAKTSFVKRTMLELEERIYACCQSKQAKLAPTYRVVSGAGETKKLNATQHKQLDDFLVFMKKSREGLETLEAAIKDVGRWIPHTANDKLKQLQLLHKQILCDEIKLKGECPDFHGLWISLCAFRREFKEKKAAIEGVVKAARTASNDKPTEEASKKGKDSKEKAKAASEGKPTKKASKNGLVWKKRLVCRAQPGCTSTTRLCNGNITG